MYYSTVQRTHMGQIIVATRKRKTTSLLICCIHVIYSCHLLPIGHPPSFFHRGPNGCILQFHMLLLNATKIDIDVPQLNLFPLDMKQNPRYHIQPFKNSKIRVQRIRCTIRRVVVQRKQIHSHAQTGNIEDTGMSSPLQRSLSRCH